MSAVKQRSLDFKIRSKEMVVCYSHSLLPLCQLTLTSPLARGDILSCSVTVCLNVDFLFGSCARGDNDSKNPSLSAPLNRPSVGKDLLLMEGGGMMWASSPTDKPLIRALESSID